MACPNCPQVPVVSERLARRILTGRIAHQRRQAILTAAMAWLLEPHHGLTVHAGVTGRHYIDEEKRAVSLETGAASELPCPFFSPGSTSQCLLGGLGRRYNRAQEAHSAPYAWLPTWVAQCWAPEEARTYTERGLIADVKACTLTRNEIFFARDRSGNAIAV